jgi:hypothetical protein
VHYADAPPTEAMLFVGGDEAVSGKWPPVILLIERGT